MKPYKLAGAFALILLMQIPLLIAFYFDCSIFSPENQQICSEIVNSNLTDSEKSLIISNLEYSKKFFPDHRYIYNKNTALKLNDAPYGVKKYNGEFVKNAWASLFGVMPSVLYKESLYVPSQTSVFSFFNYSINIPSNYYGNYPDTSKGDCQRNYQLISNNAENKIFVNNLYQNSGRLASVSINSDSEIQSRYNILVKVQIDHYHWKRYCCRYKYGFCVQYCYKCQYNNREIKQDNLEIKDSISVKKYNNNLYGNISLIDFYGSTNKLKINYSNSINLYFKDSYFKFNQFSYSINYSKPPYYFSTLKAEDYNGVESWNLRADKNEIFVKNSENCTISYFDFFDNIEKKCFIKTENFSFYIKTDKLIYKNGEQIIVSIYPNNLSVNLSYGNFSLLVVKSYVFIANQTNKITATYKGVKSEAVIFLDSGKLDSILHFSLFIFANIICFYAIKKYFWRFL